MAQIREIKTRIKSVKNIGQITKAMKMVATARLKRAQQRILGARPYAIKHGGCDEKSGFQSRGRSSPAFKRPNRGENRFDGDYGGSRPLREL